MNGQDCQGAKKGKLQHPRQWLGVKEKILDADAKVVLVILNGVLVLRLA